MASFTPYRARPIRCLGVRACRDWQIKLYGISTRGEFPTMRGLAAVEARLADWLPASRPPGAHGVGFVILHTTDEANLARLSWWAHETQLQQAAFRSPLDAPEQFEDCPAIGLAMDIWELAVLCFERQAWLDTVMAATAPSLDRYLAWQVNVDV